MSYLVNAYSIPSGVCNSAPNGAVMLSIYTLNNNKRIRSLKGEFSRAGYVVSAAKKHPNVNLSTDRSFKNTFMFWLLQIPAEHWIETEVGVFDTREEANIAAQEVTNEATAKGVLSLRKKAFIAKTGQSGKKATWNKPFEATQKQLYNTIDNMLAPFDVTEDFIKVLRNASYFAYNKFEINTRGDLYLFLCDTMGVEA